MGVYLVIQEHLRMVTVLLESEKRVSLHLREVSVLSKSSYVAGPSCGRAPPGLRPLPTRFTGTF